MSYSKDLRERVVAYIRNGGSKASAQEHFKVSRWCIYDWCSREDLTPIKSSGRPRKLDWEALAKDIEEHPDKLLRERAKELNVWTNAVWYACKQMKMTHKKKP